VGCELVYHTIKHIMELMFNKCMVVNLRKIIY
jgi:hypothetical protein